MDRRVQGRRVGQAERDDTTTETTTGHTGTEDARQGEQVPVSYTHLTLPTIYSV